MASKEDERNAGNIQTTRRRIDDNEVIIMFTPSLVKNAASHLRLPGNFVGVRSARQDFRNPTTIAPSFQAINPKDAAGEENSARLKASNDVKFCVVDEHGNERRMTKAEKKAKKFQMAQAKKEAKKKANSKRKRKLEDVATDICSSRDSDANAKAESEAIRQKDEQLKGDGESAKTYHQLPLNPTTIEQELAEFKGKRGNTPPQILSPAMALQFVSKSMHSTSAQSPVKTTGDAMFAYDHNLSQEWANRLKEQCVLPAEAVRQKEDLRPLAYRLQPEPWQRLRPNLDENPVFTTNRNRDDKNKESISKAAGPIIANSDLKSHDWVSLICRPRLNPSVSSPEQLGIKHDDMLSIVFEYIHRQTPFHVSCGSKFGADFLVYDGPRDKRHAFAGLRVLSRFTNSTTTLPSSTKPLFENVSSCNQNLRLPLPTAYSLTGFVRCLNTAGKLALLATVDEVSNEDGDGQDLSSFSSRACRKKYRVAFVDVALEKVLDVHIRKNRGRSDKKKLQKRRDVTLTLSKN